MLSSQSRLYNLCHATVDLTSLEAFHVQCEAVVTADQQSQDDGALLLLVVMMLLLLLLRVSR